MNVLDQIRPRADHLSDEHSQAMLASVLSSPAPRRKQRGRRGAAFVLSGVIVAGGAAYGTGLVPQIVAERFQQIRGGDDGWPDPIDGERLIADVPLSNGKQARVWRADTTGGQCEIRDMTGDRERPEDFGVGCWRWNPGEATDPRRGVHWQTSADGPAVVYGDFTGVRGAVARVEVTGDDWRRSFAVVDGAFAGEVPAGDPRDEVQFAYVDRHGERIARKTVTVSIESE